MDSGRPKSFNSEDMTSCRISMWDDEETTDRVGLINYCLPPKTYNGTVTSSDNYSFSESTSPYSKGPSWNDNGGLDSFAKDKFERQVAQKDSTDSCQILDKCKHLYDFGGNRHYEVLNGENSNELGGTSATEMVLGSVFPVDKYNELVHKKNNECFDEALSCESDKEHEVVENECRKEYNSMVHDRNTEQFDEALSVISDDDLVENLGLPKSACCAVEQPMMHLLELAESDFQAEVPKSEANAKTNGYEAASRRNAYSSKYAGSTAPNAVDRCSKLLSPYGYMSSKGSTIDSEKVGEYLKPLLSYDQEREVDYHSNPSDGSDDSSKFCERSSELSILRQPFISLQDESRSERGTGDWHFRGDSVQKGYPTPQYHLTRYGFSSELEQSNVLTNRYHQLQLRRRARRERKDAAVVDSTDVPGYKGNLDVEELLHYINDSKGLEHQSENHGTVGANVNRSAEKAGKKRKKGGSKGQEKQDKMESSCEKRPGDANVGLEIKTSESEKSVSETNCVDTVSSDEKDVSDNIGDISQKQEIVNDSISQGIGDSSLALKETCDIQQGSVDSCKTVTVNGQLERSSMQPSSSPLLHPTSNDVSPQRSAAFEDDFTMVTKKKKLKKNSSKRSKSPNTDCLPLFPVSGGSATLSNTIHEFVSPSLTASKELAADCYRTKTRNGASSKFSNGFKPSVHKTVTQESGLYSETQGEKVGSKVLKKLVTIAGKVDECATVAVQSVPLAAPGIGESKRNDSEAGKSTFRNLSSPGKPTLQNHENQESEKSLIGAESLLMPLQVAEGASLENGVKQVGAEKQKSSKRPSSEQSKNLSVEKLEILPSGKPQNLSQDNVERARKMSQDQKVISQKLVQDEIDVARDVSQKLSQNEVALSENPALGEIEMSQNPSQDEMAISQAPAQDEIDTSQTLLPDEESLPQEGSFDHASLSAQAAFTEESSLSDLPPSEQPVVFLDRQRGLFSVPAKKDLGLKFGHFDDCDSTPDESRISPAPGPVNVIHLIPVPYNHEDGQDKLMTDSNSLMFPIAHQYLPQLMYTNGSVQPLCKPAFPLYPNSHLFSIPMHFSPFVPPGFCVLPHTTNVPVGVVSPTMNNQTREETLSNESVDGIPMIMDGSDSCVASFAAMQNNVVEPESVAQPCLELETMEKDVADVFPSGSKRRKSVFDVWTAVEFLYSEWLDIIREEKEPNSGVVRCNPDCDV